MTIIRSTREFTVGRWAVSLLITVLCFSFFQVRTAQAATLDNAFAVLFEKLNANISAVGEVVALLPEKNEVIIEFSGDLVPAYSSELLVFGESAETLSEEDGSTDHNRPVMVYRGYVTVNESAGHLNRALVAEGRRQIVEGDQVFLPAPVVLYVTPVKNLTPYPYFTNQATLSISRLLSTFPSLQVFSLPGSNQKTVGFLQQKCRREGRYGLVLQPLVVFQNGRSKAQLRITSLFSGQSLGALAEEFRPFVAPPQNFRSY
ncbi:MAG: hypothetical protein U9Q58_00925 [Pseudomonadota bacterium]|nr:hypothetical protein [Pseudomonadota bacterium]